MPPTSMPSNMTLKRINREIADLKKEDLGALTLVPSEDSLFAWKGTIPGPDGSCYEGGIYHVDVQLPSDYPFSAPKVTFSTRIYHMNISERGSICIDILKHNWSPALSLFKVMLSLSSLLTDPNPQDPLVPSIATEFVRNRSQHDFTARHWTKLYARPKVPTPAPPPQPLAVASTSTSVCSTSTTSRQVTGQDKGKAKGTAKAVGGTRSTSLAAHSSNLRARNASPSASNSPEGSRSRNVTPLAPGDAIIIDDSDEELSHAITVTSRRLVDSTRAGKKRKRDSADTEGQADSREGPSDGGGTRRRARTSRTMEEIIVIED